MIKVPMVYNVNGAEAVVFENSILSWVKENVEPYDYQLIGLMNFRGMPFIMTTESHIRKHWIDHVNFKRSEDAAAFKLRFGI